MPLLLSALKSETLRSQVERHLRDAIASGQLVAGQKLVERQLCEQMEISRPSLREALRKLEAEKLIVQVPHRGPVVASISLVEARELYALRSVLESFVAYEFTRLATDAEIKELTDCVDLLSRAGEQKSREGVLKAKAAFYQILFAGARNSLVEEILGGLMARVSQLRGTSLMSEDRLPSSLREIASLLVCIKKRDAEGSQQIARTHVINAERAALDVLEKQINLTKNLPTKKVKKNEQRCI